jgi:hypothetical protein
MAISNPGGLLNSTPAHRQQTLSTNYFDFTATAGQGWAQQYLPDLMEQEAEVFGPRTISGFLAQVGAEEAMQADQVIWSEQGRLHLAYTMTLTTQAGGSATNGGLITINDHIDTNATYTASSHGVRVNDTVILATANAVLKALVVHVNGDALSVEPYGAANCTTLGVDTTTGTLLVYGSEFAKGKSYNNAAGAAADSRGANEPQFKSYSNKPIIMKDYYEVSGSDTARIGWVEIAAESGEAGYLWYLKAEADTRARFTDYIEMAMLEGELAVEATDDVAAFLSATDTDRFGTQGLFAAIESRGNITTGVTGVNAATDLAEFDAILAEFDKQGAIEENMMFVNRATSLAMDDMLASMNSYGAGGTSYGVFDNSEDMALNLGFSGFRRGSYDFYKSDMRYLNDKATRGGINDAAGANAIRGVIIPAGTSTVYDQMLGKNLKRPFLHVRYRASQTDDRKMKTWVTGSVGAATAALDAMQIHMLTERCLVTQGANNFMLMK